MIILCIANEKCAQTGGHFLCASKPLFVLAVDSITMISPPPLSLSQFFSLDKFSIQYKLSFYFNLLDFGQFNYRGYKLWYFLNNSPHSDLNWLFYH